MGTRNSTLVKLKDKFRVAQYGQWDGYPEGQGTTILNIMRNCDLKEFKKKCFKLKKVSSKKLKGYWMEAGAKPNDQWVSMEISDKFKEKYPYFSRDCGGKVLKYIINGECTEVNLDVEFAQNDGCFCEWAYIVNLDTNKLECYSGIIVPENLEAEFDLNNLPSDKDFLKAFKRVED